MRVHQEILTPSAQERLKALVERRIANVIKDVQPPSLREVMLFASTGGKMVRPTLTLLSCAAVGGKEEDALEAATAFELLHISSLIHDDIMDSSPMRRGHPAAHIKYGIPLAILAGDTLIALAFQLMQGVSSPNKEQMLAIFTDSFRHVCEGQGYDLTLSPQECLARELHNNLVEKKTAKLLEASAAVGALCGTLNRDYVTALARFGYCIGMAFQAQDDLLDVTGDASQLGKPTNIDTKNSRRTYLSLVYPSRDAARRLSEAVAATKTVVQEYTEEACGSLRNLPANEAVSLLQSFAKSLGHRKE